MKSWNPHSIKTNAAHRTAPPSSFAIIPIHSTCFPQGWKEQAIRTDHWTKSSMISYLYSNYSITITNHFNLCHWPVLYNKIQPDILACWHKLKILIARRSALQTHSTLFNGFSSVAKHSKLTLCVHWIVIIIAIVVVNTLCCMGATVWRTCVMYLKMHS